MRKIENFDEIKQETGEVVEFSNLLESLKPGPYICKILKVEDVVEKEYLKIAIDIADGELKGLFKQAFNDDTRQDKKWPNVGILYRSYKKSAERFFAAFVTAVEKSNNGFAWNFDETKLKDKLLVCNFAEEEYLSEDYDDEGNQIIKSSMKIRETRSIQALKDNKIKTFEKKVIEDGNGAIHEGIYHSAPNPTSLPQGDFNKPVDDLPF